MRITTVKKKRYVLSLEEIRTLTIVSSLLDEFIEDEELTEIIELEACANAKNAQGIISAILNLDETEFDLR